MADDKKRKKGNNFRTIIVKLGGDPPLQEGGAKKKEAQEDIPDEPSYGNVEIVKVDNSENSEGNSNENTASNVNSNFEGLENSELFGENEEEIIQVDKQEEVPVSELLFQDDAVYRQDLINDFLSEYSLADQDNAIIQRSVLKKVDEILAFRALGIERQYQVLRDYLAGSFSVPWIIPVVADKKKVYRPKDMISEEDLTNPLVGKLGMEMKERQDLMSNYCAGDISLQQFYTQYEKLSAIYFPDPDQGWHTDARVDSTVLRAIDIDGAHWEQHLASAGLPIPLDVIDEEGKWKDIIYKPLIPPDHLAVVGFLVLPAHYATITEFSRTNETIGNLTFAGRIESISKDKRAIITVPHHGLLAGENIYIRGTDSIPSADGAYCGAVEILDENRFTLPVNTKGGKAGTRGELLAMRRLKFTQCNLTEECDVPRLSDSAILYRFPDGEISEELYRKFVSRIIPTKEDIIANLAPQGILEKYQGELSRFKFSLNNLNVEETGKLIEGYERARTELLARKTVQFSFSAPGEGKGIEEALFSDKMIYSKEVEEIYGKYEPGEYDSLERRAKWLLARPDHGSAYIKLFLSGPGGGPGEKEIQEALRDVEEELKEKSRRLAEEEKKAQFFEKECARYVAAVSSAEALPLEAEEGARALVYAFGEGTVYEWNGTEWGLLEQTAAPNIATLCQLGATQIAQLDFGDINCAYANGKCQPARLLRYRAIVQELEDIRERYREALAGMRGGADENEGNIETNLPEEEEGRNVEVPEENEGTGNIEPLVGLEGEGDGEGNWEEADGEEADGKEAEGAAEGAEEAPMGEPVRVKLPPAEDAPVDFGKNEGEAKVNSLLESINRVEFAETRDFLLAKYLKKDTLSINRWLYSKKFAEKTPLCAHWIHIAHWLEEPSNEAKEQIFENMVSLFGERIDGGTGDFYCTNCGLFLNYAEGDTTGGFDSRGHIINVMSNLEDILEVEGGPKKRTFVDQTICDDLKLRDQLVERGINVTYLADICARLLSLSQQVGLEVEREDFLLALEDILLYLGDMQTAKAFTKKLAYSIKQKGKSEAELAELQRKGFFSEQYANYKEREIVATTATRFLIILQTTANLKLGKTVCPFEGAEGEKGVRFMACLIKMAGSYPVSGKAEEKIARHIEQIYEKMRMRRSVQDLFTRRASETEKRPTYVGDPLALLLAVKEVPPLPEGAPSEVAQKVPEKRWRARTSYLGKRILNLMQDVVSKIPRGAVQEGEPPLEFCCPAPIEEYPGFAQYFGEELAGLIAESWRLAEIGHYYVDSGCFQVAVVERLKPFRNDNWNLTSQFDVPQSVIRAEFLKKCSTGPFKGEYHHFINIGTPRELCVKCEKSRAELEGAEYTQAQYTELTTYIAQRMAQSLVPREAPKCLDLVELKGRMAEELSGLGAGVVDIITTILGRKKDMVMREELGGLVTTLGEFPNKFAQELKEVEDMAPRRQVAVRREQWQTALKNVKHYFNDIFRKMVSAVAHGSEGVAPQKFAGLTQRDSQELQKVAKNAEEPWEQFFTEENRPLFSLFSFDYSFQDVACIEGSLDRYDQTWSNVVVPAEVGLEDAWRIAQYLFLDAVKRFLTLEVPAELTERLDAPRILANFIVVLFQTIEREREVLDVPERELEGYRNQLKYEREERWKMKQLASSKAEKQLEEILYGEEGEEEEGMVEAGEEALAPSMTQREMSEYLEGKMKEAGEIAEEEANFLEFATARDDLDPEVGEDLLDHDADYGGFGEDGEG